MAEDTDDQHAHGTRAGRMDAAPPGAGPRSAPSWTTYRGSIGDRSGLFEALRTAWHPTTALNPGSYLDLSPSTAIPSVTYVDNDRRAARYFADESLVAAELEGRTLPGAGIDIAFLHSDYTKPLPIPRAGFDVLI